MWDKGSLRGGNSEGKNETDGAHVHPIFKVRLSDAEVFMGELDLVIVKKSGLEEDSRQDSMFMYVAASGVLNGR